jgi:cellulose synthase (UDP-forming)
VLVDGRLAATRIGLPAPDRPSVHVVESPRKAGHRLLLVEAPDAAGLLEAAHRLAEGGTALAGPAMALDPRPPPRPALPYDAPRWRPSGQPLRLGDVMDPGALAQAGPRGGPTAVRFRIAPDLWTWPDDTVLLDLGYAQRVPPGAPRPRLDVDLNGEFLATLPMLPAAPTPREEVVGRTSIPIPAGRLRGYNVLGLHASYAWDRAGCAAPSDEATARITPDSTLHLERYGHFASLPDLSRLLYDGFPFTRVADLGETVAILPDPPRLDAVAALLSLVAHFATITGRAGTRLTVTTSAHVSEVAEGRDLLALGLAEPDPLLARVSGHLPLRAVEGGPPEVGLPPASSPFLDYLAGAPAYRESQRARAVVATLGGFSALQQVASPFGGGRSAVFLRTFGRVEVPSLPALLGDAESRTMAGDLLVLSGERRWMFRLGPSFGSGRIGRLAQLRWFLHQHWLLLVPGFALGTLLVAFPLHKALVARAQQRLGTEQDS